VSAPAAVMMIDSPGSTRPLRLAARAPDRMQTLPPSPLMMVSSGGGAARGARWLRQLHHRMISRTLRAAVRHPIGCRAAVRGGLARPGSPATPLPPSAAAAAAAAAPTRGAAAAKALASLEMAPDHLAGRAYPGARAARAPGRR